MDHLVVFVLAVAGTSAATHRAQAVDLYQGDTFRPLVSDAKARAIGDALTVLVMETSSAATTADTQSRRTTDAGIGGVVDVGPQRRAGEITGQIRNNFAGTARTQRAGRLLAQLTVTVVGIEPNGDLRVAGEQWLEVNDEQQRIRLEGRVRPQDIGENNAVVSNRIADARIHYVGEGVLADGQRPGWIARILMWLGL